LLDRVWIIVADSGRARVLGVTGDRRGLTVLREMTSVDAHRRRRALVSSRPGHGSDGGAVARNAVAPRHDAHEAARERFISQITLMLIEDNRARQFDELILVVAPGLSGVLREGLDEPTRARVRETLVTDLVRAPLQEIHDRLIEAGLLPRPAVASRGARLTRPTRCTVPSA
jgi:protein required for attachment to host cells